MFCKCLMVSNKLQIVKITLQNIYEKSYVAFIFFLNVNILRNSLYHINSVVFVIEVITSISPRIDF